MILKKLFEKYDRIVFFDTETTGLDATSEQIIELAVVTIDRDGSEQEWDRFISLYAHENVPEKIQELTGITDEMLLKEGQSEEAVIRSFMGLITEHTLLVAYNAQFDLDFVTHAVMRSAKDELRKYAGIDYLDPLTVFKDRKAFPHKLCDAIKHYMVEEQNTHRAIDDVHALVSVTIGMEQERNDVYKYVNLFGYNPKYGIPERQFKRVTYYPQPHGAPKLPFEILPYKAGTFVA